MGFGICLKRLTNETATAAKKYGKEIQMRTWQRMGKLGDPSRMEEGILDNVYFSIKNTAGDFRIAHGLDEEFLTAAAPKRIVCEFDAWREYTGHNYFPCYMGDEWTPRNGSRVSRTAPGSSNMWRYQRLTRWRRFSEGARSAGGEEKRGPGEGAPTNDGARAEMGDLASSELQNHAALRNVRAI